MISQHILDTEDTELISQHILDTEDTATFIQLKLENSTFRLIKRECFSLELKLSFQGLFSPILDIFLVAK